MTALEAARALYGAWRLAHFDRGGMAFFDASVTGFWRSFFAAGIVAPLYALLLALRYVSGPVEATAARFLAVETIFYVISWLAFPVAMISVTRLLGREAHFVRYIVAYNWAAVLQNALYLPLAILTTVGILPPGLGGTLGLVALGAILAYAWFVAKTALDVTAAPAAGVVILDLVLSIFITAIAERAA